MSLWNFDTFACDGRITEAEFWIPKEIAAAGHSHSATSPGMMTAATPRLVIAVRAQKLRLQINRNLADLIKKYSSL